jgi:hypothetical protein
MRSSFYNPGYVGRDTRLETLFMHSFDLFEFLVKVS